MWDLSSLLRIIITGRGKRLDKFAWSSMVSSDYWFSFPPSESNCWAHDEKHKRLGLQKNMMKLKQKPITINEEIQRCTREHSTYTCRSECGWPSNPAGWPQYCNPSNSKPRLLLFVGRNPRRSDVHWPIRNISPRPEPSSRDPDLNCRPAMNLLLLLLLLLIMWKKSSIIIRNSIHPSIHPSIEQNETLCLE